MIHIIKGRRVGREEKGDRCGVGVRDGPEHPPEAERLERGDNSVTSMWLMNWILFMFLERPWQIMNSLKKCIFSGISAELCCFRCGSMQKLSNVSLLSKTMKGRF